MGHKKLRWWIGLVAGLFLAIAVFFLAKPVYLIARAWLADKPVVEELPPSYTDDASRMNRTRVTQVWTAPPDPAAAESQLRDLLELARSKRLHVSIAGARHSMGGHTIYPDGIVVDMLPFNHMELRAETKTLYVGAGARWSQIIPYLDGLGYSVAIMQSNNDFSVGGSLSVNCHGWQHNQPPIASTVKAFRLMKAYGNIVRCSRSENAELFSLALGGYGVFGIILDVELQVVPNERYQADVEVLTSDQYVARFMEKVGGNPDTQMVYGRLSVVLGETNLLREAILTVFRRAPCNPDEIPRLRDAGYRTLRREVYRAQIGSDAGKQLRWRAEKELGELFSPKILFTKPVTQRGSGGLSRAERRPDGYSPRILHSTLSVCGIFGSRSGDHSQAQWRPSECDGSQRQTRRRHVSSGCRPGYVCVRDVVQPGAHSGRRQANGGNDSGVD